jgi:hypothetical protein
MPIDAAMQTVAWKDRLACNELRRVSQLAMKLIMY